MPVKISYWFFSTKWLPNQAKPNVFNICHIQGFYTFIPKYNFNLNLMQMYSICTCVRSIISRCIKKIPLFSVFLIFISFKLTIIMLCYYLFISFSSSFILNIPSTSLELNHTGICLQSTPLVGMYTYFIEETFWI